MTKALFSWRDRPGFGRVEIGVLGLYTLLLAWTLHVHEPWNDEAQAFLIARDNSWWRILTHCLHYEGTPALWHSLIRLYIVCGGSWAGFPWFSGLFAVAGVYVLLRWSPFPALIRWSLPFTFFLLYQYAAIARSYVLFGLLVFLLCAVWQSPKPRPVLFAVLAGLLANLCVQGLCFAVVLVTAALVRSWRRRRSAPSSSASVRLAAPALIFAFSLLASLYVTLPAPDIGFYAARDQVAGNGPMHQLLVRHLGEEPAMPFVRPWPILPPWHPIATSMPRFRQAPRTWIAWQSWARPETGALGSIPNLVLEGLLTFLEQLAFPVSRFNLLAVAFFVALLIWLRKRRHLWAVLPWLSIVVLGCAVWVADHHSGMPLIALIAAAWIAGAESRPTGSWIEPVLFALTLLVIAGQVHWSYSCIRRDTHGVYDPGLTTARYLQTRPAGERRAGFHFSIVSLEPYFARNPFFNTRTSYWLWSVNADPDPHLPDTIAQHPDLVVVGREFFGFEAMRDQWVPRNDPSLTPPDAVTQALELEGYRETHRFCGERFSRLGSSYADCNVIFEPAAASAASGP